MIIDYVPGCVGAVVDVELVTGLQSAFQSAGLQSAGVFVSVGAEDECSDTS